MGVSVHDSPQFPITRLLGSLFPSTPLCLQYFLLMSDSPRVLWIFSPQVLPAHQRLEIAVTFEQLSIAVYNCSAINLVQWSFWCVVWGLKGAPLLVHCLPVSKWMRMIPFIDDCCQAIL